MTTASDHRPTASFRRSAAGRGRRSPLVVAAALWLLVALSLVGLNPVVLLQAGPAAAMHTVPGATVVSADELGLEAQEVSDHFVVRATTQKTAEKARAMAESAWERLAPLFPTLPNDPLLLVIIEDGDVYERIQPAPMTRGFATFGGSRIYLRGDQLDQEVVTHEVTHILLGLAIPPDLWIPDWFNEGLAQYLSGTRPDALELIYYSSGEDLLSLPELSRVDALRSPNRQLATLQGLAVVGFLVDEFGEDRLEALIGRLASADSFNRALHETYGLTDLQLDRQWSAYAEDNYSLLSPAMLRMLGLLTLAALATVAAAVTFIRRTRRLAAEEGPALTWYEIQAADRFEDGQPEERAADDSGPFDRPPSAS